MGWVATSALQPGMTLGAAVFNTRRQRLADAGSVLDARRINLFQAWGVVEVEVQGVAEPSLQEIESHMAASPALQQLSAEIDGRFYGAEPYEVLVELRRIVKKLTLEEQGGVKGE